VTAPARIGFIIPSSNRLAEPQFCRYAPAAVAVHFTRLRMTGKWRKRLPELKPALADAAAALSDTKPALIVFHCTANSMENGVAGEAELVETITAASGCPALTTGQAIIAALKRSAVEKIVLITPYAKKTNEQEIEYLRETGFEVIHDVGLGLDSDGYIAVSPDEWVGVIRKNARPDADGYLLSCTNTRTIEVIQEVERQLNRPVITSNQATLWACLQRLEIRHNDVALGRLFAA
jgi:maleate isomerase